jgi:peptidoglycan hydrolase-like protein with peptidoglycan-binding domain
MKKSILTAAAVLGLAAAPLALASGMTAAHAPMKGKAMTAKQRAWAMHHRMWLMKVQKALDKAGAHLKVDGYWGPKTMAAVRAFQKSHGLKATGHLDHATLAKLGLWHKGWMMKKAAKK